MNKEYSNKFVDMLSSRLTDYSRKEPNRPLCKKLMLEKANGNNLTIDDLDKSTFIELVVVELCTDAMIGALFNTNNSVVHDLREMMGYTESEISRLHMAYTVANIATQLEIELGDEAFA